MVVGYHHFRKQPCCDVVVLEAVCLSFEKTCLILLDGYFFLVHSEKDELIVSCWLVTVCPKAFESSLSWLHLIATSRSC